MGGVDKGLVTLGDQTLLARVIERLSPQVADLAISANGDPARFARDHLPVLPDSISGFPGPLAGVLAGLDWAAEMGAQSIVTVAADTPFFPCDLVPRLLMASEGQENPLVLSATQGDARTKSKSKSGLIRHPTFGLWPVALRDDLRAALSDGVQKVVLWTEKHGGRECVFPVDGFDPFFNINTPDDLEKAQRMI
ncbi:unnamed protein product [Cyprideis torosa]|uniref:MobA-like NTP transferase domain-containing protein n=1 Tax=Cyprideis torosa TaxID=163714 RepID=A0A7R8WQF9_9CRUS|nr:unnamed protein product [Cyprideis torosa]CAG0906031.1 unnamed protein product [Cyprideis torosa]